LNKKDTIRVVADLVSAHIRADINPGPFGMSARPKQKNIRESTSPR
jgi:hypothetical protein